MLRVEVLGELTLAVDGEPIRPPEGRRARELLAWLALHPGSHPRSELAARFWPAVLDSSARASLRTALHELRRALGNRGGPYLLADRERVGLDPDVWVDALEFRRLVGEGLLREALAICRGEPLPGLDEDWVVAMRDDHRELLSAAYERLAAEGEEAGNLAIAVRFTRERVKLDPLSEEATRALMHRLVTSGDRPAALGAYRRLEERLRSQLGMPPSQPTREHASELRTAEANSQLAPAERLPLPPPLRRRERTGLVGRRAELGRLREIVNASLRGERRLALVAGEPGIGKTRLLAELCRWAHARGATVLHGCCYEDGLVPYQPFAEALGWYVSEVGAERVLAAAGGTEVARLLPRLGADPGAPPLDPDSARWRLFESVAAVVGQVASGGPVLLVIDDLHWGDRATLLLLAHLLRDNRPGRLALAGAYRGSELGRGHPLAATLADLRREGLADSTPLHGLDRGEVRELVAAWLGPEASGELSTALHEETSGNPFYVGEVLRHLAESGAVRRRHGRWTQEQRVSELGVPESVKEAIGRRLARLGEPCERVLAAASIAGCTFEVAALERLDWLAGVDVLAALEEAQAAAIVREEPGRPGSYGFSHALVRETIYGELSLTRRVRLHRSVAEALEQLHGRDPEHLPEITHHYLEGATAEDSALVVDWATRAAKDAARSLAYDEAAALLKRAVRVLDGSDSRRDCELRLTLGELLLRVGRHAAAQQSFEAAAVLARSLADSELLARAALGRSGLGVSIIGVDERPVELLRQALASAGLSDAARARLVARLAIETYYVSSPDERSRLGDEAVALARRSGDRSALLDALDARHAALWSPAYLDERLASAREIVETAQRMGDDERVLQGRNWLVVDLAELGDLDAMLAEVESHEALADRLRLPTYQWWAPLWRSTLAAIEGRYPDAERLLQQVAETARRTGDANAQLHAEIQRQNLRLDRERGEEVPATLLDEAIGKPAEAAYRCGFAFVFAAQGQERLAREQIEWIATGGLARLPEDMNRLASLCELAQALALLSEPGPAEVVYDALLPYPDRNVLNARGAIGYGAAAHHLGVLAMLMGLDEAAEAHLRRALELHEARQAAPWLARTRVAYAELLQRRGDPASARHLATQARHTADELGLARLAERAKYVAAD